MRIGLLIAAMTVAYTIPAASGAVGRLSRGRSMTALPCPDGRDSRWTEET